MPTKLKKKDIKKKRKPTKKTKVSQSQNVKQSVVIHNNIQPVKRRSRVKPKPTKPNDKFSTPTTGESLIYNLLSRFQPQPVQQDYRQLQTAPVPSPPMPHEYATSEVGSDLTDDASLNISRFKADSKKDGSSKKGDDESDIARFTSSRPSIPKYDNLQSSFEEGGGGGGGGGQSEDETSDGGGGGGGDLGGTSLPTTPKPIKKKRNDPSSSSPAVKRSKRWKDFSDDGLIREIDKYNSRKASTQNNSDLKSSKAELERRGM